MSEALDSKVAIYRKDNQEVSREINVSYLSQQYFSLRLASNLLILPALI